MTPAQLRAWRGKRRQKQIASGIEKELLKQKIRATFSYNTYRSYETGRRPIPIWMGKITRLVG